MRNHFKLMPAIVTAVALLPHASVDELEKVSGIGPKSLQDLAPFILLSLQSS
jgi:DNA uptake protein ComE-like DNA-binding protein